MKPTFACRGFSLVEIAVVMIIITVLLTIVGLPLASQMEQQRVSETSKQLTTIKEAVIGFAIANGRLPCPATDGTGGTTNSAGVESFAVAGSPANGNCQRWSGFVPAVTLGLGPVDTAGFMLDAWGLTQNRIRYAVAQKTVAAVGACPNAVTNIFTATNGIKTATADCISAQTLITVCSSTPLGAAGAATGCQAGALSVASAPFLVFSLGKNASVGGAGIDETHNLDQDAYFVAHVPSTAGTAGGEFDDLVVWPSLSSLIYYLSQAGKLGP